MSSGKWLVINTQPHQESYACDHLSRQNFTIYCPMIAKRIKHARRVYDAPRPLFPGYIFVEHRLQHQAWRPILGTRGVKSLVRTGDQPNFLCGSFIEGLKARESDGVIRTFGIPLQVGQRVTVEGGPLDGFVGQIIELREKDRVLVLLDILSRPVRTSFPAESLNPL